MKTNRFLTAVSAVALLGATSLALAQGTGGGASGGMGGAAQSAPSGGGGGAQNSAPPSSGMSSERASPQAQGSSGMGGEKNTPSRAETPADRNAPARAEGQSKDMQKSNQAQDQKSPAGNTKPQASDNNSKSGSTVGSASASGGGNLTSEQRTVVREKVLTSGPRVTNVNFAINVGTVVPTSVRVVTVPQTIIDIRPEWRGYRYFVANDEIIIVEPNSLKIVAVWPV